MKKNISSILILTFVLLIFIASIILIPVLLKLSVAKVCMFAIFNIVYGLYLYFALIVLIKSDKDFYNNFPFNMLLPKKAAGIFGIHFLLSIAFVFVPVWWISLMLEIVLITINIVVLGFVIEGSNFVQRQQREMKTELDYISDIKLLYNSICQISSSAEFGIQEEITNKLERLEEAINSMYPASNKNLKMIEKEIFEKINLLKTLIENIISTGVKNLSKFDMLLEDILGKINLREKTRMVKR